MESVSDRKLNMSARIPLYLAGYGASWCGIAALSSVSGNSMLLLAMSVLLGVGFASSWAIRAGAVTKQGVQTVVLVALVMGFLVIMADPATKLSILPSELSASSELLMANMLAWLMVIHSFSLLTDKGILFMCVPALSLVGLVGTLGSDPEMVTYFTTYLALSCFVLIQENWLSRVDAPSPEQPIALSRGSVRAQIGLAIIVTAAAVLVGSLLGNLVYVPLDRTFSAKLLAPASQPILHHLSDESFVPVATGPVSLDDNVVMIVQCREPLLWRGQTFDLYAGSGWSNAATPWNESMIVPDSGQVDPGERPQGVDNVFYVSEPDPPRNSEHLEVVEQSFYLLAGGRSSVIYAAAEPSIVSMPASGPIFRSASGLRLSGRYLAGLSYRVHSLVSAAGPRELRTAGSEYPEYIASRYLGVPQSCWRAERLVQEITSGKWNAFDKAVAIQGYLQSNYIYDTKAPAAPRNRDVVDYFLFDSKIGYCDVFASAMVIMCRQAGIPARWATGYATGEYHSKEKPYVVRAKDSHAWAELYFPGYGWIAFDPTPAGESGSTWAGLGKWWHRLIRTLTSDRPSLAIAGFIVFLAGYLFKAEVLDRILRRKRGIAGPPTLASEMAEQYYRMCGLLSGYGYTRSPATTPMEYGHRLRMAFATNLPEVSAITDMVTTAFVDSRYGDREPSTEMITGVADGVQSLRRHLRAARRRRLLPEEPLNERENSNEAQGAE